MKKYKILVLITIMLLPLITLAQVRGIIVSPSDITANSVTKWPYTTSLVITNKGGEDEWIEINVFGDTTYISAKPSRFVLLGGVSKRVVISIEKEAGVKAIGLLKISATRNSPDGASIGSGIEIPVAVSSTALTVRDMQRAFASGSSNNKTGLLSTFGLFFILILALLIIGKMSVRMSKNWNNG